MTKAKPKPSPAPAAPKTAAERDAERRIILESMAGVWARRAVKEAESPEVAMYVLRLAASSIQIQTRTYKPGHRPRRRKRKKQ